MEKNGKILEFPYVLPGHDCDDIYEARLIVLLNTFRSHPLVADDDLLAAIELKLLEALLLYQEYIED